MEPAPSVSNTPTPTVTYEPIPKSETKQLRQEVEEIKKEQQRQRSTLDSILDFLKTFFGFGIA
jgi:hypothetical protein